MALVEVNDWHNGNPLLLNPREIVAMYPSGHHPPACTVLTTARDERGNNKVFIIKGKVDELFPAFRELDHA